MNYNSKAAFGRVLLYFRTRFALEMSYADMLLLEDLLQAQTNPLIIADFLTGICHCPLEPRDIEIIKDFRRRQDIIAIAAEWSARPRGCMFN